MAQRQQSFRNYLPRQNSVRDFISRQHSIRDFVRPSPRRRNTEDHYTFEHPDFDGTDFDEGRLSLVSEGYYESSSPRDSGSLSRDSTSLSRSLSRDSASLNESERPKPWPLEEPEPHQHIAHNPTAKRKTTLNPNLVTWDSPEDPLHPHNWPKHRRWTSTVLIASFAFIAPMASTMVAPALETLADEFDIESEMQKYLVMSIFLLAFAIGPFLWGPLSEVFGRARVMQSANVIFLVFNIACGFAKTKNQMMAFRFLSGIGGSAPQAIGGGVISDCFRASERGAATAIYSLMPFLSPAVAPILGGYVTQYISWRWVFWSTSIFDAAIQVLCIAFLKETHHPTILRAKAKKLRKETGNEQLKTKMEAEYSLQKTLMKSLIRPFIMLTTQPVLIAMALFRGYQYGIMYLVFATFSTVFEGYYDQDTGRASLNYLSLGVGFFIGLQISGIVQDKVYKWCKEEQVDPTSVRGTWAAMSGFFRFRRQSAEEDTEMLTATAKEEQLAYQPYHVPARQPTHPGIRRVDTDPTKGLPEYRLPLVLPFSLLLPIGLFIYGWSAANEVHWIVPNIGTCILSIGLIICFNCVQAYVVDTYTTYAASATGAAAFVRTMCGFSFPLFAPLMYEKLGIGWGNSVLAFIALTFGMVAPVLLWKYGASLRKRSTYCTG
ncbi:hypothetical protein LTR37_003377 [Vermiconidia calcicola]|uniref:Uncharacterized protein n=1 Tax=Vermiconidia calcicola TaxID=1690605 RepID=A0ACC3NQ32_9PEZI|nr:hypothetical protein LTR37_003377 [Vermiconidia calcicola]